MAFRYSTEEQDRRAMKFERLLKRRREKGLTYQQAAEGSGTSVSTLKRWAKLLGLDDHPVNK